MAYSSNRSVALCISKALFQHCRGAFSASTATALNRLHARRRNHLPSSSAGATLLLSYMKTVGSVDLVGEELATVVQGSLSFEAYFVKVGLREESSMTGFEGGVTREVAAKAMESIGGAARSRAEVAYDATKGRVEKAKDIVIADANENVVGTTEYRSMEDMGTIKTCSF